MTDDLSEYDESEFYYPDEISDTGLAQQATYFESYLLNDDKIDRNTSVQNRKQVQSTKLNMT